MSKELGTILATTLMVTSILVFAFTSYWLIFSAGYSDNYRVFKKNCGLFFKNIQYFANFPSQTLVFYWQGCNWVILRGEGALVFFYNRKDCIIHCISPSVKFVAPLFRAMFKQKCEMQRWEFIKENKEENKNTRTRPRKRQRKKEKLYFFLDHFLG